MKSCVLTVILAAICAPALAAPALAAEAAPASTLPPAACPAAAPTPAKGAGAQPAPRRLDQLPAGHLELAVMRSIGGCAVASIKEGDTVRYAPVPQARFLAAPASFAPRQR